MPSKVRSDSDLRKELLQSQRAYASLLCKHNAMIEKHRKHHERVALLIGKVTTQVIDKLLECENV